MSRGDSNGRFPAGGNYIRFFLARYSVGFPAGHGETGNVGADKAIDSTRPVDGLSPATEDERQSQWVRSYLENPGYPKCSS